MGKSSDVAAIIIKDSQRLPPQLPPIYTYIYIVSYITILTNLTTNSHSIPVSLQTALLTIHQIVREKSIILDIQRKKTQESFAQ